MEPPLIEFRNVSRIYGEGEAEVRALDGVDLIIRRGEFVAIMGPSGSGKSTTMNIIGCLDRPTSGACLFEGTDVGGLSGDALALLRRHYLGFVFQGFNLLARTTAQENVELPLIYKGLPAAERARAAKLALARVGLEGREGHDPSQLSGGQQQRVAIARALAGNPTVILADEPTGNLDSHRSHEILTLLQQLNRDEGITIVMVTHEADIAAYARRLVVFTDGRITRDEATTPVGGATTPADGAATPAEAVS
ncbi:Macrolide export ATP-binding/permease protein MacB [Pseudogemmobacter humi]|uniref:Macrolide export ATP-binding/permease protein MacB n=1 Tax=Pseudogemmobacter humi TaxID=2483812 RepID=A0A3P5XLT6_9RHOB|nr:ABC transporter ATP-binding protein [Pseudogemmobacter humi]VDC32656.1 Macrolide export ATP-binding/permease protein MacB [Pseudogemmobacter humi]